MNTDDPFYKYAPRGQPDVNHASGQDPTEKEIYPHLAYPGSSPAAPSVNTARIYDSAVTVAGTLPTSTELATAVAATYDEDDLPQSGDIVQLTVSTVVKFRAQISTDDTGTGTVFNFSFIVDDITYYAMLTQVGLY